MHTTGSATIEMISTFTTRSAATDNKLTISDVHSMQRNREHEIKHSDFKHNKKCTYCGRPHERGKCPAYGKTCTLCNKKNHFAAVCRGRQIVDRSTHNVEDEVIATEQSCDVFTLGNDKGTKSIKTIILNGKHLKMQVDTGSQVTSYPETFGK